VASRDAPGHRLAVAAGRELRAEGEKRDDRLYGASGHHGVNLVFWWTSLHELCSAVRALCGAAAAAGRTVLGHLGNLVRAAAQNDAEVSEGGVRRSDLLHSLQQRVHPPRSLRARQARGTGSERAGAGGRGRAGRAGRGCPGLGGSLQQLYSGAHVHSLLTTLAACSVQLLVRRWARTSACGDSGGASGTSATLSGPPLRLRPLPPGLPSW